MSRAASMTLITALALQACGREEPAAEGICGDEKVAVFDIIGGVPGNDPAVASLALDQVNAVGFVEIDGRYACTGTLIAPMTVLTAAHCLRSDPSYIRFHTGIDWRSPIRSYDALAWHLHPDYAAGEVDHDLAVVLLAQDPQADGIAPIPVHLSPDQSLEGQEVQAAGYGFTRDGDGSNSSRWWVVLRVTRELDTAYIASGDGTTGTCDGDSGGPLLWNHPADGVRVFAALSLGEAHTACLGDSYYTRTDHASNAGFILPYLPADPCSGETSTGRCASDAQAVYCIDGMLHEDACAAGESCRADADGNHRCLPLLDPCSGETSTGRCASDAQAVYCIGGVLHEDACAAGESCRADADGNHRCLPPGPCEAEGLDRTGRCTDDGHARWCQDNRIMDRDCRLCRQECGWTGDALGWYCMD